jgi:hypothetical protein
MSLGEAGKKRRKQIKSLRSKRTALLKQRNLSMQGRVYTQNIINQESIKQEFVKAMKKKMRITIYER